MPTYTLNFSGADGEQTSGPMRDGQFESTDIAGRELLFGTSNNGQQISQGSWTYRTATDAIAPTAAVTKSYVITAFGSGPFTFGGITLLGNETLTSIRIRADGQDFFDFPITPGQRLVLGEHDLPEEIFRVTSKIEILATDGGDITGLGIVEVELGTFSPEIDGAFIPVSFATGDDPVAIFSDLNISDLDNTAFRSAKVWIGDGSYVAGEDVLSLDPDQFLAFAREFDPETGVLTITGNSGDWGWEPLLSQVRYRNVSDTPTVGDRVIHITISDGVNDSAPRAVTLTVEIPDTDPPAVDSVTPPADDTYHWDDDLQFTVNFDEAVIVAGATPRLELKVGEDTVYADYIAGLSTATSLTFRYSVAAGDADANGVEIVGLQTNGSTIRDAAGNNADLGLTGGVQAGVLVDGVGPSVTGTTGPDPGPYGPGDELVFTVTLSGSVTLNESEESARLEITLGGETRYAVYSGPVTPTNALTFTYQVEAGDLAEDGVAAASFVDLNGVVFTDADGNPPTLSGLSFAGLSGVTVDGEAPIVESIAPDAAATNGEAVFTVTFSEDVEGVDASDFVLTPTGGTTGTISGLNAVDGRTFEVTVSDAAGAGTLRLDLKPSGTGIEDDLGNPIGDGFTAGTAVTVDTSAPEAPTINLDAGSDTGASGDFMTSDSTPKIGGTVEPYSTVEVSVGGVFQGETTASAGGSWAFEFSTPLADGARNVTALARDAAGNESSNSLVLPLTIDTAAPTLAVSAGAASLLAGQTTTLTFTFSEAPVGFAEDDIVPQFGTLSGFAVTLDPKVYTATYTPGTVGTVGRIDVNGAFQDKAANSGVAPPQLVLAINQVEPDPEPDPPPPPPPAPVIDGVPVTTTPGTSPSGTPTQTVTIPVVTSSRPDTVGGNNVADIPIVAGTGTGAPPVLAVQAPAGYGLQASGPSAPQTAGTSLTDLIREIQAHTTAGSADQTTLTGGGGGFLQSLTSSTPLLVQTIVPTGGGASAQPLVINGAPAAAGDPMTALVIDTRGLTSGSTVQLNNVEFAAVIGAVTVTGGAGSQVVYGDGASQNILLGEDDDVLHGGGGTDTVASAAGNDRLFGDEGADSVSGGIGDDFVHGNAGADTVSGGDGNDQAYGGKDDDRVSGDAGSDLVWGDLGNDFLHGNAGADTVDGGLGADSVHGGQGDDYVAGGEGDDVVLGDLGDDFVQGGIGNDRALGGAGNDVVHGGQGDDAVSGDEGDDWLSGDRGNDTLTGGLGADRFHAYAQTGKDVVLDFNAAEGDRVVVDIGDAYTVSQGADGVVIAFSAEHQMLLRGVQLSTLAEGWIVGG